MIERLDIEEIKPSSRRYPAIIFDQDREAGDQILSVDNLSGSISGEVLFNEIYFNLAKQDKVIIYSKDTRAVSLFYDIITEHPNLIPVNLTGVSLLVRHICLQIMNFSFTILSH